MRILFACVLILFSKSVWAQNDVNPQGPLTRNNGANHPGIRDLVGRLAPDFELPALDGTRVKLSGLRGKVVVLNFWATYCGPCKIYMPWFVELQNEYGPQGFQ